MDGLAKAGSVREAKAVFDEMKAKNVRSGMFSPFRFEFVNQVNCPSLKSWKKMIIISNDNY